VSSRFVVFADGFEADLLEGLDNESRRKAAVMAINKTVRDLRKEAADMIRDEVALPAKYVSPGQKRLYVSQQARGDNLEARITARGRATSLARFATGNTRVGGRDGVYIEVHPGKARLMRRAFLIPLKRGTGPVTDTNHNLGLAIRLSRGEALRNKYSARRIESGLYLLYGPSVSQVFRNNAGTGVAKDMVPEAVKDLRAEFERLVGNK
jgi:hypothetical protein